MNFGRFQVIEKMERETGLEPATSSLGSWHSRRYPKRAGVESTARSHPCIRDDAFQPQVVIIKEASEQQKVAIGEGTKT